MDRERARCFHNCNYEICAMVASPKLTTRRFSYSLSQVRGIASVQPRYEGDLVAIAAHV